MFRGLHVANNSMRFTDTNSFPFRRPSAAIGLGSYRVVLGSLASYLKATAIVPLLFFLTPTQPCLLRQ